MSRESEWPDDDRFPLARGELTSVRPGRRVAGSRRLPGWGETWNIGVLRATVDDLLSGAPVASEPRWLFESTRGQYPADPCLVETDGRVFLFFEQFDCKAVCGSLYCAELGAAPDGTVSAPRRVLDEPFHLSHPSVFRHRSRWYLLPEAAGSGSVRLYGAVEFPWTWELVGDLLPGFPGLDPTLVEWNGRLWLFASRFGGDHDANLHAFHATELPGPWLPHAANPVRTGRCGARPAGPFLVRAGRLYRPAQDSFETYGQAVVLHEVTRLDPETFEETPVARLAAGPTWASPHGAHTLCVGGAFVIVDAKRFTGLKALAGPWLTRIRRARRPRRQP